MSAIGISPADIVKAVQLIHWLHQHCFTESNRAGFQQTLETLQTQVEFIESTFGHGALPAATSLRQQFAQAAKEFNATLKDCEKLLATHKSLDRHQAGFFMNVRFGMSIQNEVKALEDRILAHNTKIQTLLGTLQVVLTRSLYDGVHAPADIDASLVPQAISAKFSEALDRRLHEKQTVLRELQQEDKIEALQDAWHASTFDTPAGIEQTATQHLNLLKTVWIIIKLRADPAFRAAPPGFPYRMTIQNIQRSALIELERHDLTAFSETSLLALDEDAFNALPPEEPQATQPLPDERPWEKKLLELSLPDAPGCVRHTLMVYHSGPGSLRLVREKVARDTNAVSRESETLSVFSDLLIPYYAASPDATNLNMVVRNRTGTAKTAYLLSDLKDVFDLQRAITGFEVLSDMPSIAWLTHRNFRGDMQGEGRIQIWRLNPIEGMGPDRGASTERRQTLTSDNNSSALSQGSMSTNSTFANVTRDLHSSITDSSVMTMTDSNVVATGSMPPPLLVIFTKSDKGTFEFLAIDMARDLEKQPTKCECSRYPRQCLRTVLRNNSGGFIMRKFSTESSTVPGPLLDRWNLSVFSRISVHNVEQHPDCTSRAMEEVKEDFLSLDFETIEARLKFDRHFAAVSKIRDQEERRMQQFYRHATYLANRPKEARKSSMSTTRRDSVASLSPSVATIRPTTTFGSTTTTTSSSSRTSKHGRASSAPKLPEFEFGSRAQSRGSLWP